MEKLKINVETHYYKQTETFKLSRGWDFTET